MGIISNTHYELIHVPVYIPKISLARVWINELEKNLNYEVHLKRMAHKHNNHTIYYVTVESIWENRAKKYRLADLVSVE